MPNQTILNYILKKHDCHTVILYGSRVDGTNDATSDYDILAIRDSGDFEKDCAVFEGCYLDAFIYSEGNIIEPDSFLIRIKDGIVLAQKNKLGDELLSHVTKIYEHGPEKTPAWEKQEIISWLPKMLERAKRNDVEGNYRRHWLQTELLKCGIWALKNHLLG